MQDKDATMATRKRTDQGRELVQWVGLQKGERGDFGKTFNCMRYKFPFFNAANLDMRD